MPTSMKKNDVKPKLAKSRMGATSEQIKRRRRATDARLQAEHPQPSNAAPISNGIRVWMDNLDERAMHCSFDMVRMNDEAYAHSEERSRGFTPGSPLRPQGINTALNQCTNMCSAIFQALLELAGKEGVASVAKSVGLVEPTQIGTAIASIIDGAGNPLPSVTPEIEAQIVKALLRKVIERIAKGESV